MQALALTCRGSELLREVAWVIFDEVHYMQDRERGVVWEEAIIFLPKGVRMVFLSATLSNASEFAGWVCHLHQQPCHVVYTDFRPTPLQHYAFPVGGSGLYLVSACSRAACVPGMCMQLCSMCNSSAMWCTLDSGPPLCSIMPSLLETSARTW